MKWSAPTLGLYRRPIRISSLPTALRLNSVMSNTLVALLTTPQVIERDHVSGITNPPEGIELTAMAS
jgi:hypothetical protein